VNNSLEISWFFKFFFSLCVDPHSPSYVLVLPKLRPFNVGEDPLYLKDAFQLFCSVIHGDSPFTFEWLFENVTIEDNIDTRIESGKRSSTLSIESVNAKHTGLYTCRVLNMAGAATISTALVVKG
jgi:Immunoglobulin domain